MNHLERKYDLSRLIPKEESIHSFLIRYLMQRGELRKARDINGLVSQNFNLSQLPRVKESHQSLVMQLGEAVLKEILLFHSFVDFRDTERFNNDFDYVFRSNGKLLLLNVPTKQVAFLYCPKCMRNDMLENGFSWFRLNWQRRNLCDVHETRLCIVKQSQTPCCGENLTILDNIISAMTGNCFKCGASDWSFAQYSVGHTNLSKTEVKRKKIHFFNF